MANRVLHVWGDSIGKGIIFDEQRNRYALSPDRCADQLQQTLGIPVHNHARMGATVVEGLAIAQSRGFIGEDLHDAMIALEYGGNDCDLNWAAIAADPTGEHEAKVPLPEFRQKLTEFVRLVLQQGGRPVLVTPPPLEASRYFAWVTRGLDAQAVLSFLGDVQHIYRWQERYALAVRDVAREMRCALFDVRDAFLAQRNFTALLCIDGIHPNSSGQAFIARQALNQWVKLPDQRPI